MALSNDTTVFVTTILSQFKENKLIFGLFGNHTGIPEIINSDIDIWLGSTYQPVAKQILTKLAEDLGWKIIKPPVSPRLTGPLEGKYYLIHKKTFSVLQLDFWSCIHWRGLPLFNESEYVSHIQIDSRDFNVLDHTLNTAITLLRDILYKNHFSQKSHLRLRLCNSAQIECLRLLFVKRFGGSIAQTIFDCIEETSYSLFALRMNIIFRLLRNTLIHHPFRQIRYWGQYLFGLTNSHIFASYGLVIAFIGTDGAGKSTLIETLLQSNFAALLFEKKFRFHTKLSFFPALRLFRFKKRANSKNQTHSPNISARNLRPLPILQSMVYPLYYGIELAIGNIWVRKQKRNAGALILFDRYFYEYLIQDEYHRCPRWWIRLLTRMVPKPDMVICLNASPELIRKRKPELPIHIIRDQLLRYKTFCSSLSNGYIVDTSNDIDNSLNKIYSFITEKL